MHAPAWLRSLVGELDQLRLGLWLHDLLDEYDCQTGISEGSLYSWPNLYLPILARPAKLLTWQQGSLVPKPAKEFLCAMIVHFIIHHFPKTPKSMSTACFFPNPVPVGRPPNSWLGRPRNSRRASTSAPASSATPAPTPADATPWRYRSAQIHRWGRIRLA